jgi:CRP-like cAMP-binding protein
MDIRSACDKIQVFKKASPASLAGVLGCVRLKQYGKRAVLFRDREGVGEFYFLVSGLVSLFKVSGMGERKVVFLCKEGEMLNEVIIGEEVASIEAEALTDCQVLVMKRKDLEQLMAYDYQFCKGVMESMAIKIRRLYRQMKNTPNSVRLDRQIGAKIWKLCRDYGNVCEEGVEIGFDITISFLAEMVGAKRETVSRQVKVLVEQGLIQVERRRVKVLDQEKLVEYIRGV